MECPWKNLEVEVDSTDGAYYQGLVKNITEDGILVSFKEYFIPDLHVKFENVRLPSKQETENKASYRQGEVHSKAKYLEYLNREGKNLVQCGQIRHPNLNDSFKKLTVKVPHHLKDICEEDGIHDDVIKHSGVLTVIYSQQQSTLIFVSANETIHKKASMLADMHVKMLHQKKQRKQNNENQIYSETFIVSSDLAGRAIGKHGSNIRKARDIPGVSSVNMVKGDDAGYRFYVHGETKEAVKKARSILEFCKETFKVPSQFAGVIIGKNGKNIDDIMNKSLAKIIKVDQADGVSLDIIGTPETIENAKLLLNFKLNELQEDKLMIRKANNHEKFDQENIQHIRGHRDRRRWRGRGGRSRRGKAKMSTSQDDLHHTPLKQNTDDDQKIQEFQGEHDDKILFKQDFVDLKTTATYTETGGKTDSACGRGGNRIGGRETGNRIRRGDRMDNYCDITSQPPSLGTPTDRIKTSGDVGKHISQSSQMSNKEFLDKLQTICTRDAESTVNSYDGSKRLEQTTGSHVGKSGRRRRRYGGNSLNASDSECSSTEDMDEFKFDERQIENGSKTVHQYAQPIEKEVNLVKSYQKFNALFQDTVEDEDIDKIDKIEILKHLVQIFDGGCSFGEFLCSDAMSLFVGYDTRDWFSTHGRKFHIYRNGSEIVYIAPFYRELNICKHFFNPSNPSCCENPNCNYFHICRNFVRGNCKRRYCSLPHNFSSPENEKLKEKYKLEDFNDSDIIVLLNWKFGRLCHNYIYKDGCNEDECPYLHFCKNFFFNKCNEGDNCTFNHSLGDTHNKWVLRSCHLGNQSDDSLRRLVYVPPIPRGTNTRKDSTHYAEVEDHSDEEKLTTALSSERKQSNVTKNLMSYDPLKSSWQATPNTDYMSATSESSSMACDRLDLSPKSRPVKSQTNQYRNASYPLSILSQNTEFPKTYRQVGFQNILGKNSSQFNEGLPESEELLLSENAMEKHICISLTKRDCPNSACQDLHLQHGVPFLWQIKLYGDWVSFLPKDNFHIEQAYCTLCDDVCVQDLVYNGEICSVEVHFMKPCKDMYGIVNDSASIMTCIAKIRRLSTPSFGDKPLSVDSYVTQWRWYWKDNDGAWLIYGSNLQIYTLEVKFLKHQKTYLLSRDNYTMKYRLCFTSMQQVNVEYGTRREILRRPIFVSKNDLQTRKYPEKIASTAIEIFGEDSKPVHFHPWDLANEFELVELDSTSGEEYTEVLSSFQKTMRQGKYEVEFIYRVQNRKLWSQYQTKKKHMHADAEKDNPSGSTIDERRLFHGTDTLDICRGICINNFDFRKSGKNATVYGQGSYFARDASYSHSYTKASESGERYMFRAQVLVGKFIQGSSDYRRPPEIPGESHKLYDACVDSPIDPSIFVVFDRSQTYPEYLIKYTVKTENVMTTSYGVSSPSTSSYMHQPVTSSNPGLSSGSQSAFNSLNSSRNTSATNFVRWAAPSVPTQKPVSSYSYSSGSPSTFNSLNSNRNTHATNVPSVTTQKPASSSSYSSGGNSRSGGFHQSTQSSSEYRPPSNPTPQKSSSDCAIL